MGVVVMAMLLMNVVLMVMGVVSKVMVSSHTELAWW